MLKENNVQSELINKLLTALNNAGILSYLVFVGSWAIYFYKHHFKGIKLEPIRTSDIDIDVSKLIKAKEQVNIPDLLKPLDFDLTFVGESFTFLSNPALRIEFLSPEVGRGSDKPLKLKNFGITAQPLRFLDLLERDILTVDYNGLPVNVPHPVWFGIHKLIISQRRQTMKRDEKINVEGKSYKDVLQGLEVLAMINKTEDAKEIELAINSLTEKQKKLMNAALKKYKEHIEAVCPELIEVFNIR